MDCNKPCNTCLEMCCPERVYVYTAEWWWKRAERRADREIAEGKGKTFNSVGELLSDLHGEVFMSYRPEELKAQIKEGFSIKPGERLTHQRFITHPDGTKSWADKAHYDPQGGELPVIMPESHGKPRECDLGTTDA